ncbi:MAG: cytochrome P450 [Pseudomarimonas sp.]
MTTEAAAILSASPRFVEALPGPRGVPFFGNALQIDSARFHHQCVAWAQEFGTPFRLSIGRSRLVVWDDPGLFHAIARERPGTYWRGARIQQVAAELGFDGILTAYGAAWRQQRECVMRVLNPAYTRAGFEKLVAMTEAMYRCWCRAATIGAPIDLMDELRRFTLDDSDQSQLQAQLRAIFFAFNHRLTALVPRCRWLHRRSTKVS